MTQLASHLDQTTERFTARFLSPAGWGVAIALCVMFTGMMHDFRSVGLSQDQVHEDMLEARADFNADISSALPERKVAFVLSGLIAIYCWLTATRKFEWQSGIVVTLVIVGLVWAGASILWSLDRHLTARSMIRVVAYAFLCYSLTIRFTPLDLIRILVVVSVLSVGVAIATELAVGSSEFVDEVYRLDGSMHPNSLSRFALLAAIPAFAFAWGIPSQRLPWAALFIAAFAVIHLSRCRTSLVSALAGIVVLVVIRLGWRRILLPASLGVTVLAVTILAIGIGGRSAQNGAGNLAAMGRSESVSTLTGRIPLWEVLVDRAAAKPILGYGYGGFWNTRNVLSIQREVGWQAGHSHNCYIEILVNLGLVGLILFVALLLTCFLRSARLAAEDKLGFYAILAALIAAAAVNGLAEVGFVLPREHAIVLALFAFMAAQSPVTVEDSSTTPIRTKTSTWNPLRGTCTT